MLIPNDWRRDGSDCRQIFKMIEDGTKVYVFYYHDTKDHYQPTLVNLGYKDDAFVFTIPGEYEFVEPHDAWGFWISDSFQEAVECYNDMIDEHIKHIEQELARAKQEYYPL